MVPANPLLVSAALFGLCGLAFLFLAAAALKRKKTFGTAMSFVLALLMLSLSALSGSVSIAVQGYRALTREDLAAFVIVEPAGEQTFTARFSLPDGVQKTYSLAGDQLYVDARILKWKPWANILGLHTSYQLDRVTGRYENIADEMTKVRTVHSLMDTRPLDLFDMRRRFAFLSPLLDAEYGSATFINVNKAEELRIMVSTTGLLIRKNEISPGP